MRAQITPEELQRKQEALRPLTNGLDLLTDHVVITDTDSNILYANKAAQDKSGLTLKEMLGKNPGDLWGGHMPKEVYVEMYHALKDLKQSWHGLVKNRHKDGKEYWQWLRVNPILDDNNECIYFVAIEPDIDGSKFETVDQINQSLVESVALKDFLQGQKIKITDLTKTLEDLKAKLNQLKEQKRN